VSASSRARGGSFGSCSKTCEVNLIVFCSLEDMAMLELPLERQLQKPFVGAVRDRCANRVFRCRRSGSTSMVFLNVEKIQFRSSE